MLETLSIPKEVNVLGAVAEDTVPHYTKGMRKDKANQRTRDVKYQCEYFSANVKFDSGGQCL